MAEFRGAPEIRGDFARLYFDNSSLGDEIPETDAMYDPIWLLIYLHLYFRNIF